MFGSLFASFDGSALDDVRRIETELNRIFDRLPSSTGIRSTRPGAFPPINVGFTPERVDVYLFAAGLDPTKVDITIQQNLLAISGTRAVPIDESANYYRKERFEGEFRRVVTLPDDVDPERVEARYRDGVLQITIQRREAARPRQISIN